MEPGTQIDVWEFCNKLYFDESEAIEFLKKCGNIEIPSDAAEDGERLFTVKQRELSEDENKALKALQPLINIKIIESKRERGRFKDRNIEEIDKMIYHENYNVSRKFIITAKWKDYDSDYIKKVAQAIYKKVTGTDLLPQVPASKMPLKPSIVELKISPSQKALQKQKSTTPTIQQAFFPEISQQKAPIQNLEATPVIDSTPTAVFNNILQKQKSETSTKKVISADISKQKAEINLPSQPINGEKIVIIPQKPLKKDLNVIAKKKLTEILKKISEKQQKLKVYSFKKLDDFSKALSKEMQLEFIEFRENLKKPVFEYGLIPSSHLSLGDFDIPFPLVEKEEDQYKIFPMLAKSLADKNPLDSTFTFKAMILSQIVMSIDDPFIDILLKYLSDGLASFYSIDPDELPQLFLHHDILFNMGESKKNLRISYTFYDEQAKCQELKDHIDDDTLSESIEEELHILPTEIASSNIIFFILSTDTKTDQLRFNCILNFLKTKRSSSICLNIIFLQPYEVIIKNDNIYTKKKSRSDILENFKLTSYMEAGKVHISIINIAYYASPFADDHYGYVFPKLAYSFDSKLRAAMQVMIEEQDVKKEPRFYNFDELANLVSDRMRISMDQFMAESITYNISKPDIFYTEMNSKSIESYFYCKAYNNQIAKILIANIDNWSNKIDKIPFHNFYMHIVKALYLF